MSSLCPMCAHRFDEHDVTGFLREPMDMRHKCLECDRIENDYEHYSSSLPRVTTGRKDGSGNREE